MPMPDSHRLIALGAGVVFAATTTRVLSWLAALALGPGQARAAIESSVVASIVAGLGFTVLPAALLAFVTGYGVLMSMTLSRRALIGLVGGPWVAFAAFGAIWPYPAEVAVASRMHLPFGWSIWVAVVVVPAGLWLAAETFQRSSAQRMREGSHRTA